jgi:type 1 fimbria pilin
MVVWVMAANAVPNCWPTSNVSFNGVPSGTTVKPLVRAPSDGGTIAGTLVASGIGTASFTCTGASGDYIFFTNGVGETAGLISSNGADYNNILLLLASSNKSTPPGPNYGSASIFTASICAIDSYTTSKNPIIIFNTNGDCSVSVSLGYSFYLNSNTVGGVNIGNGFMTNTGTNNKSGWMYAISCGTAKICSYADPALAIAFGPTINLQQSGTTCSVDLSKNSKDRTIILPTLSSSSFPSVGSTAGTVPFSIAYSCLGDQNTFNTNPILSIVWLFEPSSNSLGGLSLLANGNTDNGIQIQLLDSNGTAINSGVAVNGMSAFDSCCLFTYTANFKARYVRSGAVTPGAVSGTASYTLMYQ